MAEPSRTSPPRVTRRALLLGVALPLALGAAVGCSSTPPPVRFLLEPVIAPRANQNSPVPVAIVAVTDKKLFERVLAMTAKQWFEQREQLRRDFPGGDAFTEWEWEYVPGQAPPLTVIEVDGRAAGAVIFANYRTPGDHRLRIGPQRKLRIELGAEDVSVAPLAVPDR
jgi:type VI secretion system protein